MGDISQIVLSYVSKEMGVKSLNKSHEQYVLSLFRSMNPTIFKGHKLSQVGPVLGKVLGDKLKQLIDSEKAAQSADNLNIKEYQIAAIGAADQDPEVYGGLGLVPDSGVGLADIDPTQISMTGFLGINDITEFKLLFNPESMLVHYYLVLDSNYRDTTEELSNQIRKFTWKYTPTQNIVEPGFCNSVGVIRDVVGMRMYQPRVPYLAGMNTSSKRVSVLVEEFAAQAFIGENGRRFHFLLRPNYSTAGTSVELSTEDYNDGIFNFRKPFTTFDKMTISFGDPLNILTFATPFDRFIICIEFVCLKSDK